MGRGNENLFSAGNAVINSITFETKIDMPYKCYGELQHSDVNDIVSINPLL